MDPELKRFIRKYRLKLTKNAKEWPSRSLSWGPDVRCGIQIFLVDQATLTFNFWLCAIQDRTDERFWKQEYLRKEVHAAEIAESLSELLETGKRKLDHWSAHPDELEFATKIMRW
jgi:hypothetical protein